MRKRFHDDPPTRTAADVVISIGCDLGALPQPWEVGPLGRRARNERWLQSSGGGIRKRVTDLVEQLVRSMPKIR